MARQSSEGLSLLYRLGWRFRYVTTSVFGPAQLGTDDPQLRLRRERERKVAAARARREAS
ncbi:hypothetical protein [Phycicoccus sonneratiae]|uniref:Uncharacterized protein n=1 Tax=Phycicoccus sonneratiae TaxID=2807628 RepID=A0ABS2CR21_9MICO|nr:hypothetical protein [Phycicoccus sonneraticus]MBM6402327.1 hypothetical protein [Phycicoccus sonneraticus]